MVEARNHDPVELLQRHVLELIDDQGPVVPLVGASDGIDAEEPLGMAQQLLVVQLPR